MIPDLTFSKLADLENQMLTDFDNIALRSTNSNDELTPVPSTKYEILPIVMLISLSMSGIVIILILTRRRCLQDAESDLTVALSEIDMNDVHQIFETTQEVLIFILDTVSVTVIILLTLVL
eukprot:NP_508387.1 Uncharacterized protein CELE_T21D9.2 [Caenorhabditis elegans]